MLRVVSNVIQIFFIATVWSMTVPHVLADDPSKTKTDSDGFKLVPYGTGNDGKPVYIRVRDQLNPFRNLRASGTPGVYDPRAIDYSKTCEFAGKSFSSMDTAFSKKNSALESDVQREFVTKSYFDKTSTGQDRSTPNLDAKVSLPPETNEFNHAATGQDKSYSVSGSKAGQDKKPLFADNPSEYQNQAANLGGQKIATYLSPMNNKPYLGPETEAVHRDLNEVNEGLMKLKDLPNRPLSIDEVRALINHGVVPDTDVPPAAPSKALNDPDYEPDPAPAPPPADDSGDAVPSPGTMAAHPQPPPENSEPLPNK